MNKLRVAAFHHNIIMGGAALCFLITELGHLWMNMLTNLHVRLWELLAKKSADILSFCISFYYYLQFFHILFGQGILLNLDEIPEDAI